MCLLHPHQMQHTTGRGHLLHQRLLWLLFHVFRCPFNLLGSVLNPCRSDHHLAFYHLPGRLHYHRRRAQLRLCVSMYRQVCPRVLHDWLVQNHNPAMCHQMCFQMHRSILLPRVAEHQVLDAGLIRKYHHAILAASTATTQPASHEVLVKLWQQASPSSLRRRTNPGDN